MKPGGEGVEAWPVRLVQDGRSEVFEDPVVVEEPLELRLVSADHSRKTALTMTMRTPGHDEELVRGILYSEGIIESASDVLEIRIAESAGKEIDPRNRLEVRLRENRFPEPPRLERSYLATSACGVCGKTAVDEVFATGFPPLRPGVPRLSQDLLVVLPQRMRQGQSLFARTGGIHAAALFDASGKLRALREDIGRHNAVDKVIGATLVAKGLPAGEGILLVSGRAGFEIGQKALRAGIPVLASLGAPSTLTLRLAARSGMTVVGFLGAERFNLYTGRDRLRP